MSAIRDLLKQLDGIPSAKGYELFAALKTYSQPARAELRQKDDALKAAREYLDNLRRRGGFNESRDAVIRLIDKALG